jgi:hypothetical protein
VKLPEEAGLEGVGLLLGGPPASILLGGSATRYGFRS